MWWHSAAKHVPVVSAPLRLRTQSVQFGSDTINLRTTSAHTTNKLTTPTLQTTLRSDICCDSKQTP